MSCPQTLTWPGVKSVFTLVKNGCSTHSWEGPKILLWDFCGNWWFSDSLAESMKQKLLLCDKMASPETHEEEVNKEIEKVVISCKKSIQWIVIWLLHETFTSDSRLLFKLNFNFFWCFLYGKISLSFGSYHFKLILSPDNPVKPHEAKTKFVENTTESFKTWGVRKTKF